MDNIKDKLPPIIEQLSDLIYVQRAFEVDEINEVRVKAAFADLVYVQGLIIRSMQRNPYAKYKPDGSIEMIDIDMDFDHQMREVNGELFDGNWMEYDDDGELKGIAVNVGMVGITSGPVRAMIGRSQTTETGTYCEIVGRGDWDSTGHRQ